MKYSYSRLKAYDCPKRFFHLFVKKEVEPVSESVFFDRTVHLAIENYVDGVGDIEDSVSVAIAKARQEIEEKGLIAPEIDLDEVKKLVENTGIKPGMGVAMEPFELPLDPDEPFSPVLYGSIDLRTNQGIVDWKTGYQPYNPNSDYQLGLYAWAVSQKTGLEKIEAALKFLRLRFDGNRVYVYTKKEMEEARKWALDRAIEIEEKLTKLELGEEPSVLFPAKPSSGLCPYCAFVVECQRTSEARLNSITAEVFKLEKGELVINSLEAAEEIGAEIIRLKSAGDKLTDALKKYVAKTGEPVVVGKQQYGPRESISWVFTAEQKKNIAHAMHENGLNPWELFTLGARQLKDKEVRELGWDENTFKSFGGLQKTTISYRWSSYTPKGDNKV